MCAARSDLTEIEQMMSYILGVTNQTDQTEQKSEEIKTEESGNDVLETILRYQMLDDRVNQLREKKTDALIKYNNALKKRKRNPEKQFLNIRCERAKERVYEEISRLKHVRNEFKNLLKRLIEQGDEYAKLSYYSILDEEEKEAEFEAVVQTHG